MDRCPYLVIIMFVGTGDVKVWILYECRESAELFSLNGCKGPTCAHCIASLYCTLMSRSGKTIFTFLLYSWFWRLLQCISNRTVVLFQPVLFSYLHTDKMEVAENRRCEDELVCGGSSSGRRLAPGCFSFWLLHSREQIHVHYCLTAQTVNDPFLIWCIWMSFCCFLKAYAFTEQHTWLYMWSCVCVCVCVCVGVCVCVCVCVWLCVCMCVLLLRARVILVL